MVADNMLFMVYVTADIVCFQDILFVFINVLILYPSEQYFSVFKGISAHIGAIAAPISIFIIKRAFIFVKKLIRTKNIMNTKM